MSEKLNLEPVSPELLSEFFATWMKVGLSMLYRFTERRPGGDSQAVERLREFSRRMASELVNGVPLPGAASSPAPAAPAAPETEPPLPFAEPEAPVPDEPEEEKALPPIVAGGHFDPDAMLECLAAVHPTYNAETAPPSKRVRAEVARKMFSAIAMDYEPCADSVVTVSSVTDRLRKRGFDVTSHRVGMLLGPCFPHVGCGLVAGLRRKSND